MKVRRARVRQGLQFVVYLLDLVDEPRLPDVTFLDLQGEHHQVAHAEVVLGIQVGCHVAVAWRQQGIRIVADIQVLDLQCGGDGATSSSER